MYQLEITDCPKSHAQTLCDWLEREGSLSITLLDQYDEAILEPELGTTPLWPIIQIQALFTTLTAVENIIQNLGTFDATLSYTWKVVKEEGWEKACLDAFKPMAMGDRLWITPSWCKERLPNKEYVILDPGLAFGTGTHPTTALCLQWLDQSVKRNQTFIDYGCGSGILSLAALKLGARFGVAVDLDPQALIATKENARLNQIEATSLSITTPSTSLSPVDFIIANILLKPLLQLKSVFAKLLLHHDSHLVVSGVLVEQMEELTAHYQPEFVVRERKVLGDWGLLVLSRI